MNEDGLISPQAEWTCTWLLSTRQQAADTSLSSSGGVWGAFLRVTLGPGLHWPLGLQHRPPGWPAQELF